MAHKTAIGIIDESIGRLRARLLRLQNPDGGFKGYHIHDKESGIWTTAEATHVLSKEPPMPQKQVLTEACRYLVAAQNPDGGWPFRKGGKSITDITAWVCLALSHHGPHAEILRGIRFILTARTNEVGVLEAGWGLTSFEPDRVYSTHMAAYCLGRILASSDAALPQDLQSEMRQAISESKQWVAESMNPDGGWSPTKGSVSSPTSTALALVTLFMQGENPEQYVASLTYLRGYCRNGLWAKETEVVITREGYELAQEWFSSAFCLRAYIFFAEMDLLSFDEIDNPCQALIGLIEEDGTVRLDRESAPTLAWPVPFALDALSKYRSLIRAKREAFDAFVARKALREAEEKQSRIEDLLHRRFPYPIAYAFFQYQHELDHQRKFQLAIQLYEVVIKYATIVSLAGYLSQNSNCQAVNEVLQESFQRPTLGSWTTLLEALLRVTGPDSSILNPVSGETILKLRQNYIDDTLSPSDLQGDLSRIVRLRNENTGHGAMKSMFEYRQLVEYETPLLLSFIDRMAYLSDYNSFLVLASEYDEFGEGDKYRIRSFNGLKIQDSDLATSRRLAEGQKEQMVRYIYFQNTHNNLIVNLYPFLSCAFCRECKREHFFFFNGKKSAKSIAYLSYECGHLVEHENCEHFGKRLRPCGVEWV